MKKIFLISPVAHATPELSERIGNYVAQLEAGGHRVHWPARDAEQNDPTGGYTICQTNFRGIIEADEIHIWYDETSNGSKFDMGGVFMLIDELGWEKKVVIVNSDEVVDNTQKSFYKVMKHLTD